QRRWVPNTGARPTARSQDNPNGVGRFGGQARPRPDPTPASPRNAGSRAGALTHILPAESELVGADALGLVRGRTDYPVPGCAGAVASAGAGGRGALSRGREGFEAVQGRRARGVRVVVPARPGSG